MTIRAYILIEAAPGTSTGIARGLEGVPGIVSALRVFGPYDVIAVMEQERPEDIHTAMHRYVHTLKGVMRTVTCIAISR